MTKVYRCLLLILLIVSTRANAAQVQFKLQGVDGAVAENINAYLAAIKPEEYSTSLRFQARLDTSIHEALRALGYYHGNVSYIVSKDNEQLIAQVTTGPRVHLDKVDIQLTGEAQQDKDFLTLIAQSPLKKGAPLNHNDYDNLKSALRSLALRKGYFNAKFTQHRLEVIPSANFANISLHLDSGIRYHFGEVRIHGSQIKTDRVMSLLTFKQGDPYLVSKIGQLNQNLSNSGWFSSIVVDPDINSLNGKRELPVDISVQPQSRNRLETGLGYSTDVQVRGTLKWNKPWVNSYGHSFDSSLSISGSEQTITAGYQIPLADVLHDYYRIEYGMKNVDNRDTQSLESNLALERHWILQSGWHRTVYARYLVENYEQGEQDDIGQFVLPGFSFSRSRTRAGRMPMWGDKQSIMVEYGDDAFLSETQVLRTKVRSVWIRGIGNNHRGIVRIEGGANFTHHLDKLSPSLRFFAGGDNNLRGYAYESVSPKDSSGSLTGAKYMLTSTLEYQYRLTGNWWGALFVDNGDAFNRVPDWKTGAGFGVRWASPIGPVRLDFAWGLDLDPGDRFRIHFTLGPEL